MEKAKKVIVSIKVPEDIHRDFKVKCAKKGVTMNERLTRMIENFLDDKEGRRKKVNRVDLSDYKSEDIGISVRLGEELHKELKIDCAMKGKQIKDIVKKCVIWSVRKNN